MDIVYLVKVDPANNSEELRYSLRSLKNIPHNKVFIVGEKPDWATNVEFIPVPQINTKHINVAINMRTAVESELVSDDFILMNDDFFFMKNIPEMPNLNFGLMSDVIAGYHRRYSEVTPYIETMISLYETLIEKGFENPISYELHIPMVLNKQNVLTLWQEVTGRLYQFRTYYGNYFNIGGTAAADVKLFIDDEHNPAEYVADPNLYLESQTFLSVTGGSFKRGLPGEFVRAQFPDKSPYEL